MNRHFRTIRLLAGSLVLYAALNATVAHAQTLVNITSPVGTDILVAGQATEVTVEVSQPQSPITSVEVYADDTSIGLAVATEGRWVIDFTPASEGVVELRAEALDEDLNTWISGTFTYTVVDTEIPMASILFPADGSSYLPGTNLPVQVSATDADGLVNRVDFILNDVLVSTIGSAPFRTEIQLPSIGSYTLQTRVVDNQGAQGFSEIITLNAGPPDEVSPRVVIDFPLPLGDGDTVNDVSYASAMFLNATVKDPDGGTIEEVEFFINGQSLGLADHRVGDVFSYYFDPNALGNYLIATKATDNDGNVGWSVPLTLDVGPLERPLPKAEMIQPFPESILGRVVGLFVDVDGGLIDINRVDFFANGVFVGSADEPVVDNLYSFDWVPEEPGDYDLQARVVQIDPAGATWDNWTIADPVGITIVEPPVGEQPSIEITNPVDGSFSIVLRQMIVQASGLDPLGSIEEVRFYVNGKQVATDSAFPYGFTYVPQSPGLYQVVAEMVSDRGLLVQSDPASVTVGVTDRPSGTFISPSDSLSPTAGSTVPITIDANDPDGYIESIQFFVNGTSIGADNSTPFTVFWTPSSRGIYDVDAIITDNSGNEELISNTITVVDPVGIVPRVTMSVTGSGNVTPGSRVVVLANVFDDTPENVEVTFFLNGSQLGETDTEAPYSVIVDPEGGFGPFGNSYSLTALATDPDGNSRADVLDPLYVSDFSVDQPSIEILNIEEGDNYTKGSRVPIRIQVGGGAASNLANLVFYADGVEIGRLAGGEQSGRYTLDWLPDETGTVEITAASLLNQEFYDHDRDSGSVDSTPRIPVTPVNVAFPVNINVNEAIGNLPSISLDVYPNNENLAIGSKVLVYADAQDLGGNVTQVEFFNDGVSVGVDTQSPFTHEITTSRPGDFALNALVTDSDGNVVTSTVVNLGVEDRVISQTPEIFLTVPESGREGNLLSLLVSTEGFVLPPDDIGFFVNGQRVNGNSASSFEWNANLSGNVTFFSTARQTLSENPLVIVTTVSEVVERNLADNLPPVISSITVSYPNQDPTLKPNPVVGDDLTFQIEISDNGPVEEVLLFRDGEAIAQASSAGAFFLVKDENLDRIGTYQYSVIATDRGGLQTQSSSITVTVVAGSDGVDPNLPSLELYSTVIDNIHLPYLPITFTLEAPEVEGNISLVELQLFGENLNGWMFTEDASISGLYTLTVLPPFEVGAYVFSARIVNDRGDVQKSQELTIVVQNPSPLSSTVDLVGQTLVDLLVWPSLDVLDQISEYNYKLTIGDQTFDQFVRELIKAPVNDPEDPYKAVRGVILANRLLLGKWASRDELEEQVRFVLDGGTQALVSSLMSEFEEIYNGASSGSGVPDEYSSDSAIGDYISYLFQQKYGVVPTASQMSLAKLHFRSNGRDLFTAKFIEDVEVVATSSAYLTIGLGFKFDLNSAPSDDYLREADAASLLVNLLRVSPSDGEVSSLAQKLFATQVSEVLIDPRYSMRFSTAFRNLEHHSQDWKFSEWFGWFNTSFEPWVYHVEQGWIAFETSGQTEDNFWYYDAGLGWVWTNEQLFPLLYDQVDSGWMLTPRAPFSGVDQRWFYSFAESRWITR